MRALVVFAWLLAPAVVTAKVLNVEFKFVPYVGDAKNEQVTTVAGTAHVFLNNVPLGTQEVRKEEVPVMFDGREIASAVWVPVESLGPAVRRGRNTFRIEFQPTNKKAAYKAQLRWASVTDQVQKEASPGRSASTNQADEGVEEKNASGTIAMERQFTGDFATDQPWHHLPAVTALTEDDKQALGRLVQERVGWFEPDFASFYEALEQSPRLPGGQVGEIRNRKCLDAAHDAGVRITAVSTKDLDFVITGGPEVVVRGKKGTLYPPDPTGFERIKGNETQMCAGMALSLVYPNKLVAVRQDGAWKVVY
jgi:hypothetical protein